MKKTRLQPHTIFLFIYDTDYALTESDMAQDILLPGLHGLQRTRAEQGQTSCTAHCCAIPRW